MRFFFFLLFVHCCNSLFAVNYFVSPSGSDSNMGTIGDPFLTIQHALHSCSPGDTVFVRAGTYNEKLNWSTSGTPSNKIVLQNYLSEEVIVDGGGIATLAMLTIHSKSYIEVDGIIFQNNYRQYAEGIHVYGEASDITIKRCTIRNIGWTNDPNADPYSISPSGQAHGILFNGRTAVGIKNIRIVDNVIHDIITGNSEALTLVGNIDGFEIRRDTVYDTKNIGIVVAGHYTWAVDPGVDPSLNQSRNGVVSHCVVHHNRRFSNDDAPAGIYVDGGKNVEVTHNISYQNGNGISVGCENANMEARGINVSNNLVYDNDNNGIVFGSNAAIVKKSTIFNNTFFQNGSFGNFRMEIVLQNSDSCTIAHNILIPRTDSHYGVGIFGYTVTQLTVDENLVYRYSGGTSNLYVPGSPAQFSATNTINMDPQFLNASLPSPDLHLNNNSPAINQGTDVYSIAESDFDDNYRIVNGSVDYGAYERQDGGCPDLYTIDDDDILLGKFVAAQKIILNRSQTTMIDNDLLFNCDDAEIMSPINLSNNLTIDNAGCQ